MFQKMKKAYKPLLLTLIVVCACLVALFAACGGKKEYTLHFVTNGGGEIADIVAKEGDEITPPQDPARDGYKFNGWYLAEDLSGDKQVLPTVMPAEDRTYYAGWLQNVDYSVNVYLQDYLTKEYSRSAELSRTGSDVEGADIKATTSDLTVEGYTLNEGLSNTQIKLGSRNAIDLYFDINSVGHIDINLGEDVVYTTVDAAYLERPGFESLVKSLQYNAATGYFLFGEEGGVQLEGKIADEGFFWYKDIWFKTFKDGQDSLVLKEGGQAQYTKGGVTTEGVYYIDATTTYFVYESDGVTYLFDLDVAEETFHFCGDEYGWYAFRNAAGELDYDLMFIDGFGGYMVFAVSPSDPEFNFLLDTYTGSYEKDADDVFLASYIISNVGGSFPFKIIKEEGLELDGYELNGTYLLGDFRGEYSNLDTDVTDKLYLDGFGKGTYKGTDIEYELVEDAWPVDNYPSPQPNYEDYVKFTFGGQEMKIAVFDAVYTELTSSLYGRKYFNVAPLSIYPGSSGETAFLFFNGYRAYDSVAEGEGENIDYADLWFGTSEPLYSVPGYYEESDLPLYNWRDSGVILDMGEGKYRYESNWEFVIFDFTFDADGKIVWNVAETETVFTKPDDANGEIKIDQQGKAWLTYTGTDLPLAITYTSSPALYGDPADMLGAEEDEDFDATNYIATEYDFEITVGVHRRFLVLPGGTIKEIKHSLEVYGMYATVLWFDDDTSVTGLDLSVADSNVNAMFYCVEGTITPVAESERGEYQLNAKNTSQDPDVQEVYDTLANFRFIMEEVTETYTDSTDGSIVEQTYEQLRIFDENLVLDMNTPSGHLVFDGYGYATFKGPEATDEQMSGEYHYTDLSAYGGTESDGVNGVYYLTFFDDDGEMIADKYVILSDAVSTEGKTYVFAAEEAGTYFLSAGSSAADLYENLLTVDGNGYVYGSIDTDDDGTGEVVFGTYVKGTDVVDINDHDAFELTITVNANFQDVFGESFVIACYKLDRAMLQQAGLGDQAIGFFFLKNEEGVGEYTVVDDEGTETAYLEGDGYLSWTYFDGAQYTKGVFYRGNTSRSFITDKNGSRDFTPTVKGTSLYFSDNYDEMFFDIIFDTDGTTPKTAQDGSILLKRLTMEYGAFRLRDSGEFGDNYIYMDGHGKAAIYKVDGDEDPANDVKSEDGSYEAVDEYNYIYRFVKADGTTGFMYQLNYIEDKASTDSTYGYVHIYTKYDGSDATYISSDWEVLMLSGYGNADFLDKYGEYTPYEYFMLTDTTLALKAEGERTMYLKIDKDKKSFTRVEDEFIFSDDGVLYAYNGNKSDVVLDPKITRVTREAFAEAEITSIDLANVVTVDDYAFNGQFLTSITGLKVKTIGSYAFALDFATAGLSTLNLPAAEVIGDHAFFNHSGLISVTFGANLQSVGDFAFSTALSAGTLIIDVTAVEDLASVQFSENVFSNMEENVRVVTDKENLEAIIAQQDNPVAPFAVMYTPAAAEEAEYFFDFATGDIYIMDKGIITRNQKSDDRIVKTVFCYYTVSGSAKTLYLLSGTTLGEGSSLPAGDKFTVGGVNLFKTGTGDPFEFTADSHTVGVEIFIDCKELEYTSVWAEKFTVSIQSVTLDTAACASAVYDFGAKQLTFVSDGNFYSLKVTSATEATLTLTGSSKAVDNIQSGETKYRVTFVVGSDGKAATITKFEIYEDSLVGGPSATEKPIVSVSSTADNTFTLKANVYGEDVYTYTIVYISESSATVTLQSYTARKECREATGNFGLKAEIEVSADGKIIGLTSLQVVEGFLNSNFTDAVFTTYQANDDGSLTVTAMSDGGTFTYTLRLAGNEFSATRVAA